MIKVKKTTPDSLVSCDSCSNKATQLVLFQKDYGDLAHGRTLVLAAICDSCSVSLCDELGKNGALKLDYVNQEHETEYDR